MAAAWTRFGIRGVLALGATFGIGSLLFRANRPRTVSVTPVVRGSAVQAIYATGRVEPHERLEVKARVSGPVMELLVHEGDTVHRGDVIARIDVPVLGFEAARGEASLRAARARASASPQIAALRARERVIRDQMSRARAEEQRTARLVEAGSAPASELERIRESLTNFEGQIAANAAEQRDAAIAVQADVSREQASVAMLHTRTNDAEVRAPMDGLVLRVHVQQDEVVAVNQDLVRIGDVSDLQIEALVDESDVGRLRVNTPSYVRMFAFNDRTLHGSVTRIAPDADRERNAFRVTLHLGEPCEGLRPGMTAEINMIVEQHDNVLLAPADGVVGNRAWVLDRAGVVRRRNVTTGLHDLSQLEILSGLNLGDLVIVGSTAGLQDNQHAVAMLQRPSSSSRTAGH